MYRIELANTSVKHMKLTETQKKNLEEFLEEKGKIVSEGEMKEHHLLRMEELGFGNGGVVLKVQHKPTGIIMARKVRMCVCVCVCGLVHPSSMGGLYCDDESGRQGLMDLY